MFLWQRKGISPGKYHKLYINSATSQIKRMIFQGKEGQSPEQPSLTSKLTLLWAVDWTRDLLRSLPTWIILCSCDFLKWKITSYRFAVTGGISQMQIALWSTVGRVPLTAETLGCLAIPRRMSSALPIFLLSCCCSHDPTGCWIRWLSWPKASLVSWLTHGSDTARDKRMGKGGAICPGLILEEQGPSFLCQQAVT